MARKLVKSLLLAASCGAGMAFAADTATPATPAAPVTPAAIPGADSTREAYSIGKQEEAARADEFLLNANQAFSKNDYKSAAYNYAQAALIFEKLKVNSEFFAERYEKAKELVAKSYYFLAQDIAVKAQEESNTGDLERAIAYCKEAIAVYPACEEELKARIELYEKMHAAAVKRTSLADEQVIPGMTDSKYKIAVLLKQAKILYYARQYKEARDRYNEVLMLDKINPDAIQGIRATNIKIREAGEEKFRVTHKKMMAEAAWEGTMPIIARKDGDIREENGMDATTPLAEIDETMTLRNKLKSIIIPQVKFSGDAERSGVPLPVALKFLRERSKVHDPAGEGVNIFLYFPDPADRGMGMDGMGMDMMPGGANMDLAAGLSEFSTPRGGRSRGMTPGMGNGMGNGMMPGNDMYGNPVNGRNAYNDYAEGDEFGDEEGDFGDENGPVVDEYAKYPLVNLDLINNSLLDIIDALASATNLKYKIEKNCVVLAPKDAALDDMEIKVILFDESLLDALGGSSDPEELKSQLETYDVPFPAGAKVMYDPKFRVLIALNTPENLNKISEVVVDLRKQDPPPLVQLQVKFVEVRQNDLKELGFIQTLGRPNGDADGNTNGRLQFNENDITLFNSGANTITYQRSTDGYNYNLTVNALNQLDGKDVLSSPKVLTNPGKQVTIKMTTEEYFEWDYEEGEYETNSSSSTSGSGSNTYIYTPPWPEFEMQELGITMDVTPTVDVDKRLIMMNVRPWIRSLVGWSEYSYVVTDDNNSSDSSGEGGGGEKLTRTEKMTRPIIAERTTDTTVSVFDNETIVIGGIIKDRSMNIDDKIPLLGDIPIIGKFFTEQRTKVEKTNLLIFLTARMLKPDGSSYYKFDNRGRPSTAGLGDLY